MIPRMRFEGGKELEANLMLLEGVTAKKVVRESLQDALVPVEAAAVQKVRRKTGRLARSIGIGLRLTRRQKSRNVPIVSSTGVEAYVGPGARGGRYDGRHGHLVEFGTRHSAPFPFMSPAWAQNIKAVFDRLAGNMAKKIDEAVAKMRVGRR